MILQGIPSSTSHYCHHCHPLCLVTIMINTSTCTGSSSNPTNDGVLSRFEPSFVRCLTRSDEALLKTALALVLVHNKHKHKHGRMMGASNASLDSNAVVPPTRSHVSALLTPTMTMNKRPKLLQQSHRDHMDHLFHVACRSISVGGGGGGGGGLPGLAAHLVEQLDSWAMELAVAAGAGPPPSNKGRRTNIMKPLHHWIMWSLLSHPNAATVHRTMMMTISSRTRAVMDNNRIPIVGGWSHHHLHHNHDHPYDYYRLLIHCWWEVVVQMILELDHPQSPPQQTSSPSWCLQPQSQPQPQSQQPSGFSLDRLAVSLLDLLQTLCQHLSLPPPSRPSSSSSSSPLVGEVTTTVSSTTPTTTTMTSTRSSSSRISHDPLIITGPTTTGEQDEEKEEVGRRQQQCPKTRLLESLVFPLPTPESLVWMHDSLLHHHHPKAPDPTTTTTTTTTRARRNDDHDEQHHDPEVAAACDGLTVGGKMLLRLGLYRILILEQPTHDGMGRGGYP